MLSVYSDEFFMKQALNEANKAVEEGEVPVGAVIVVQNTIISRTHNLTERLNDVTAHAEIMAITSAASHLGSKYLPQCTIYVTLEPCPMCAAALHWAQIGRLVYGAEDEKNGYMRFGSHMLHPKTQVAFGVQETACRELLQQFFRSLR